MLVTYAIVKHGFTDARIVITKTGLLLGVYLIVLGVPFLIGFLGHEWLEQWLRSQWWTVPLGLSTVLATIGPFAYATLRNQAEERLLGERRRYQRALQLAAQGMTRVRDVRKLAHLITRFVSRAVHVTHASLFLWDETQHRYRLHASHGSSPLSLSSTESLDDTYLLIRWLEEHRQVVSRAELAENPNSGVEHELSTLNASLVIPGFIEDHLLGFLVLGAKRSGKWYSADDLHAFGTLAHEAAVAIENALSYEEVLRMNEQLKVASERLLVQERMVAAGQFATGMAHEIKNPLSAIKTFAQYLPEKYADPAFREKFFRIVQQEIDRITDIVKDLSDFAKPNPPQPQPVRVVELVEDVLSLLSNQCITQNVELHRPLANQALTVHADPQQLKQVLLNLCLNSLEAMPDGGQLDVSVNTNHRYAILRVIDTGCGIMSKHQQEIWSPFFTTKERGMGLGLAIVKGIIERHGGDIALSSTPGKGTTVEFSLPFSSAK